METVEATECPIMAPEVACASIETSKPVRHRAGPHRGGPPKGNANARKHGLGTLRLAATQLGSRVIDGRSSLSYALKKFRRELIADLGGAEALSAQQFTVIDLTVKSKLFLDSIDAWLLSQPSLINKRKRSVLPVVMQRQQLADSLAKYMSMLGLERRAKQVPTIAQIMAGHDSEGEDSSGNGKDGKDG